MNLLLVNQAVDAQNLVVELNQQEVGWDCVMTMRPDLYEVLREARVGSYKYDAIIVDVAERSTARAIASCLLRNGPEQRVIMVSNALVSKMKQITMVPSIGEAVRALACP